MRDSFTFNSRFVFVLDKIMLNKFRQQLSNLKTLGLGNLLLLLFSIVTYLTSVLSYSYIASATKKAVKIKPANNLLTAQHIIHLNKSLLTKTLFSHRLNIMYEYILLVP